VRYAGEHVTAALRAARKEKRFSQRELSAKTGVPQSHISKIEQGAVDLQLSSLIELARALGLEIMTVPRKLVPAVQAIVRGEGSTSSRQAPTLQAVKELRHIVDVAERLNFADKDLRKWRRFRQSVSDLENLRLAEKDIRQIRSLSDRFKTLKNGPQAYEAFLRAALKLQQLRNAIIASGPASLAAVRPAYTLDEGDDA
jgi:transcriptional regulator with XRE-family HTH domain